MNEMYRLTLFAILCGLLSQASGHGRLMEPVGRASAWRVGFPTPHNNDDNALFCGGFGTQQANGGKCGVCGDPWNGRRDNEAGGIFATGTIVKKYKMGQVITTKAEITANHKGWMEYRICPNNNIHKPVTQECLDRYVLQRADGRGTKVLIDTERSGYWNMDYKLPDGLTCTQCVIQWKYHTGNNWGVDRETGQACKGCGPQEEFYGCADVAIDPTPGTVTPSTRSTQPITAPAGFQPSVSKGYVLPRFRKTQNGPKSIIHLRVKNGPSLEVNPGSSIQCRAINLWAGMPDMDRFCRETCAKGNCPVDGCSCTGGNPVSQQLQTTTTTRPTTTTTSSTMSETQIMTRGQCKAINLWAGNDYLDRWCADTCARGNCPPDSCHCEDVQPTPQPAALVAKICKALGPWKGIAVFDKWCTEECNMGNCPPDACQCIDARLQALSTTTTAVKSNRVCTSNMGDYCNGWCQQHCDRNYCPVDYCRCT